MAYGKSEKRNRSTIRRKAKQSSKLQFSKLIMKYNRFVFIQSADDWL
jgi:hypothetical protein